MKKIASDRIKELIQLANELDVKGLPKEADALDEIINEIGNFSDLDDTNITKDEAFQAGAAVCGTEEEVSKLAQVMPPLPPAELPVPKKPSPIQDLK